MDEENQGENPAEQEYPDKYDNRKANWINHTIHWLHREPTAKEQNQERQTQDDFHTWIKTNPPPSLQKLAVQYGGGGLIPEDEWTKYDQEMQEWNGKRIARILGPQWKITGPRKPAGAPKGRPAKPIAPK